jgi:hypothetical protein
VALAEWEIRTKAQSSQTDIGSLELVLGKRHFKRVAEVSQGFDQYMTDLMGGRNESEIAASNAQRYDFRPGKRGMSNKESTSDSDSEDNGLSDSASSISEGERKKKKRGKNNASSDENTSDHRKKSKSRKSKRKAKSKKSSDSGSDSD